MKYSRSRLPRFAAISGRQFTISVQTYIDSASVKRPNSLSCIVSESCEYLKYNEASLSLQSIEESLSNTIYISVIIVHGKSVFLCG
jgi:hypothetical protein